jgi:hypothetical protein
MHDTGQNRSRIPHRITAWLVDAVTLQLILTGASLPFLLWWDLPFPLLSIIGNIIHPLFLTLFLVASSLLFFATLLALPTQIFCIVLNTITTAWEALLTLPIPSGWILLRWWHLIPLYLCVVIVYMWKTKKKKSAWLSATFVLTILASGISIYYTPVTGITVLHRQQQSLVCIPRENNTLELIDHGYISHASNIPALVNYELMPHILTRYGKPAALRIQGYGSRIERTRELLRLM